MKSITVEQTKKRISETSEFAFIDVREHGQYGEGHPFFCVNLPYSRLEHLATHLMPRRSAPCILLDAGDDIAARASDVLHGLGFTDVSVLDGGAPAWGSAGHTLFKGVNLPSKTFGELVEHTFATPSVSAEELHEQINSPSPPIVLDGRSEAEFRKMSIPSARSCPNAELGHRISTLSADPNTPIVINCAGRTRSIIGAQSLIMLEVPNPVYALRNGTQGWRLAGFDLCHGVPALQLPVPDTSALKDGHALAERLQRAYSIPGIDAPMLQSWLKDPERTTYLFDVRTEHEFAEGHVKGARWAPGGQLVQATDEHVAVRNARIVLSCDNGLRSTTTAIWLAGMGHNVWVLDPNTPRSETGASHVSSPTDFPDLDLATLKELIEGKARILDVSKGMDYRAAHIASAVWGTRARLDQEMLEGPEDWVLVARCPTLADGAVREIRTRTGKAPRGVHVGTPDDWRAAGLEIETTPNSPSDAECIDHLFFVHDRHDGNLDAARRYLEWETGLLDQLDEQERGQLQPLKPRCETGITSGGEN